MTLSTAVPKPKPREKSKPKPIKRSSPVARSTRLNRTKQGKQVKPIPKVNGKAKAKRAIKARKHYASPEYKAARKARQVISGGRCEAIYVVSQYGAVLGILLPDEISNLPPAPGVRLQRCGVTEQLQFHEESYGSSLGLQRPIRGFMLCPDNHAYIERTRHPTRSNGRSV